MNPYFDEAEPFMESFADAKEYGMQWEFCAAFFKALGLTQQQVWEACVHARREWDL